MALVSNHKYVDYMTASQSWIEFGVIRSDKAMLFCVFLRSGSLEQIHICLDLCTLSIPNH
jgi:hypothetical protein